MDDMTVLKALTGLRLSTVGRHAESLDWLAPELLGLKAFVSQQGRIETKPPHGPLGDLVRGWSFYYQSQYTHAFENFDNATDVDVPWVQAFAMLGKGKVCTDLGFFADAARWCANSSCIARRFEHDDLVAAAHGARGEILLRTGHPRLAIEAYTLDMALLAASDRYRGRVMCYQAHAYSRLGAFSAAKLAYRTSAQQPGENTAPYVYAGLALLGAESDDFGLVDEAVRYAEDMPTNLRDHPGVSWIYTARSRVALTRGEDALNWCKLAQKFMPAGYLFEHQWLTHWLVAVGGRSESASFEHPLQPELRSVSHSQQSQQGSEFDCDPIEANLFNEGLAKILWSNSRETLWTQRRYFVP